MPGIHFKKQFVFIFHNNSNNFLLLDNCLLNSSIFKNFSLNILSLYLKLI